jgi:hypothetical protein
MCELAMGGCLAWCGSSKVIIVNESSKGNADAGTSRARARHLSAPRRYWLLVTTTEGCVPIGVCERQFLMPPPKLRPRASADGKARLVVLLALGRRWVRVRSDRKANSPKNPALFSVVQYTSAYGHILVVWSFGRRKSPMSCPRTAGTGARGA